MNSSAPPPHSSPDTPPDADAARRPSGTAGSGRPSSGRPGWLVALPVLLVMLAGAGWSGAWFYAAGRAGAEIDAWIAREAEQGRNWSCGERSLGGFPFRFELSCAAPKVTFAGANGWQAEARRAHAVAQVWAPNHIIAEFEGPSSVTEAATGRRFEGRWSLLQASGVGSGGRPERVSVVTDGLEVTEAQDVLLAARHVEIHVRRHPGEEREVFDLAAGVHGARGAALPTVPGTPAKTPTTGGTPARGGATVGPALVDAELQARLTGLEDLHSMPLEERLRAFQAADGRLNIVLAKLSSGDAALAASGDLGLDARGRLDGAVKLSLAGGDKLMARLAQDGLLPPAVAALAPTLLAAGTPAEIDGRKGVSFPFGLRGGKVMLGFIPLGSIGALY